MPGKYYVRVEKFQGQSAPLIRLSVYERGKGQVVSALLSWNEAIKLMRDIAGILSEETVLIKGYKTTPSGWKRTKPKKMAGSGRGKGGKSDKEILMEAFKDGGDDWGEVEEL